MKTRYQLLTMIWALCFGFIESPGQWTLSSVGLPNGFGFYEGTNIAARGGTTLYTAQNQKLFKSTNNGSMWEEVTNNFPSGSRFIAMAGNDSRIFVTLDTTSSGNVRTGRLFSSADAGKTWVETGLLASANTFSAVVASGNLVFVYSPTTRLHRSTDGGNTWTQLSTNPPARGTTMAVVGNDLYLATDLNVHRSTDQGESWAQLNGITGAFSIASDGATLYAGTRPAIYKSTDNGQTWTTLSSGLPANVDTYALYISGSTMVASCFRGSFSSGVYRSTDGGQSWAAFNDGYPSTPKVGSLVVHGDILLSATSVGLFQNGGIYKRPLSEIVVNVERIADIPGRFTLHQNYPNPFNPSTTIRFTVSERGNIALTIVNLVGQEIARVLQTSLTDGEYQATWNAEGFPSGVYFYRLQSGSQVQLRKMMLVR